MGTGVVEYRELRFIFEDGLTQVYVYLYDLTPAETPMGAQGWHHKAYPAGKSAIDILRLMKTRAAQHDPLLWDNGAPPTSWRSGGPP